MPEEWQESGWVIHPSLWFDAVCLIPLLAGLPFYTSRHDQDAPVVAGAVRVDRRAGSP